VHLPRLGQLALVEFLEGDPARPIVTGRVYSQNHPRPYALPDDKTQSGIRSRTVGGGAENFNELRFEDKKGAEHILLHAEKNLMVEVENHRTTSIGGDCTTDLHAKPTDSDTKGEGHQTLTIHKGNQTSTLKEGNQTVTLEKGDQTIAVKNGDRSLTVNGKDATKVTTGDRTVTVADGNHTVTVDKGNQKVQVKMGNDEVVVDMGNHSLTTKMGNIDVKASLGKVTIEALQGIELKCGANSIKIDQTGITVKGMMVKVEGMVMAQVKSPMTQVNGDAMLMAKGGITMIN
jgi:type VI secretion system secreted protein VgrG